MYRNPKYGYEDRTLPYARSFKTRDISLSLSATDCHRTRIRQTLWLDARWAFRRGRLKSAGIPVLGGLKVAGIDRHHLDRRCLVRLRRNDDCGGYAVVNWKGQSLDQFLVGHDLIVSRRQDPVDPLEPERMAEGHGLALRTRGHWNYAAARRASGNSALSYKRRISMRSNRSSSTSRQAPNNNCCGNSSIANRSASAALSNRRYLVN